mmetsp:Transcript_2306/g.3636  ORF Transcript_2306/g.3636 Transcript_2306/m.3636 type:complete len:102 (+) Transcript_2306:506-811(+)
MFNSVSGLGEESGRNNGLSHAHINIDPGEVLPIPSSPSSVGAPPAPLPHIAAPSTLHHPQKVHHQKVKNCWKSQSIWAVCTKPGSVVGKGEAWHTDTDSRR